MIIIFSLDSVSDSYFVKEVEHNDLLIPALQISLLLAQFLLQTSMKLCLILLPK